MNVELENRLTKAGFEKLLTPLLPRLGSLLKRQLRGLNNADMEGALQAALLDAWEKRDSFERYSAERPDGTEESKLIRWLAGLVQNKIRDLRKEQRKYVQLKSEPRAHGNAEIERKQRLENAVESSERPSVADAIADGLSDRATAELTGTDRRTVAKIRRRLRNDIDWPAQKETDADFHVMAEGTSLTGMAHDYDQPNEEEKGSWIDREIGAISAPKKWSDRGGTMLTKDPDITAAIIAIDARKKAMNKKRGN